MRPWLFTSLLLLACGCGGTNGAGPLQGSWSGTTTMYQGQPDENTTMIALTLADDKSGAITGDGTYSWAAVSYAPQQCDITVSGSRAGSDFSLNLLLQGGNECPPNGTTDTYSGSLSDGTMNGNLGNVAFTMTRQ